MNLLNFSISPWVDKLNSLPPELVWGLLILVCFSSILLLLRVFGEFGLYAYIIVAMFVANIQVMTATQFSLYENPIALGTVLFSTLYLCTDILNEYYGPRSASRAVMLSFCTYLLLMIFMFITLGFKPISDEAGPDYTYAVENYKHIYALFMPMPALFISGMLSYLISQYHDIWLYQWMKKWTSGRSLWLRNNLSTALSALIDNAIFSILAWIVFAETPLPWDVVVMTYILGTYLLRIVVAAFDTPILYLAKRCLPPTH